MNFDVVTSIEWMPKWSTTNWIGNDRYRAYVRLAPGTEPASLSAAIRQMQERHQDLEQLAEAGIDLTYSLLPLSDIHNKSEENRNINRLLILLGAVLILVSVLNYVLMVVSSLISRTKEIAVNKCYGASWRQLVGMTLSESALHLALALILGAALVIIFRHKAEELLSASISALFSPQAIAIIAGLCVLVLAATVGILTWLYSRVPVAAAFSSIKSSKRIWKLCLLFAQFAASAYVVALLFTISKQYNYMMSAPMGYEPDNLLIISNNFASDNELRRVVNELESLPEVESASYASTLPFEAASGNNVYLPGDPRELFNLCDLYHADARYLSTMGIPLVEGEFFQPGKNNAHDVVVSRSFAERMAQLAGWTDSPVGKQVLISEHSRSDNDLFTIIGVYDDFVIGNLRTMDQRPSVMFGDAGDHNISSLSGAVVRMRDMSPESVAKVKQVVDRAKATRDPEIYPYSIVLADEYHDERNLRDSIIICGVAALVIALVGLTAYIIDETNRRRREIAIRKVNGASSPSIVKMIIRDVTWLAAPALAIGAFVAYMSATSWLQRFAQSITPSLWLYLAAILLLYLLIMACVIYRSYSAATSNPTLALKSE